MAVFTVPSIFKAIDKISAPARKMQASIKAFGASTVRAMKRGSIAFDKFNRKVGGVFSKINKKIGGLGVAFGGLAVASIIGGAISVFADFEQANANLAAVMGVTVEQNKALTDDAKRLGSVTAKTASEVVGLQEAYARLGFGQKEILNMTEATISGSVAMRAELSDTANLVGAMVKSFDNLGSSDAPYIVDMLTKSTQASALSFEKLQTALPYVAANANALGVPLSKTTAMLGVLADAGIDASSSGTALRKMLAISAKQGKPLNELLKKISNSTNKVKTATEIFGLTAASQAAVLANNIDKIGELDKALQNSAGTAGGAASKQLDTLKGRLTILGSAWEGFILNLENGDGKFANFLKTIVEVATEVLAMASGTAKMATELKGGELRVRSIALKVKKFLNILKGLAKVYFVALAAQKALIISTKIYQAIIKIGHFMKFVSVFIKLAKAKGIATAAQKMLNISVAANPYVAMGIAIAAVIGIIYKLVTAQSVHEKMMEDVNNRTREIASEQIVNLDNLFRSIQKTNTGSAERIALVQKLKQQYPGVNAQMEKELINNKNLTESYKFLRAEIIKTAKAKAIQEKIGEQANKIVDFELKLQQKGVDSQAFLAETRKALMTTGGTGVDAAIAFQKVIDKFGVDEGIISNVDLMKESIQALTDQKVVNDLMDMQESMNKQKPAEYKAVENINSESIGDVYNNMSKIQNRQDKQVRNIDNKQVQKVNNITNNQTIGSTKENVKTSQQNGRIDLYINNRTKGEIQTSAEGTGVKVENTGY